MKKLTALLAAVLCMAAFASGASAKGNLHKPKNAPVAASFTCDVFLCAYSVPGLTPNSFVSAKFAYVGDNGHGTFVGTSLWPVNSDGVFSYVEPVGFLTLGNLPSAGHIDAHLTVDESWTSATIPNTDASAQVP